MSDISNEKVGYFDTGDVEFAAKGGMKERVLRAASVETQGIDRVPEDEREGTHSLGVFTLWMSVFISLTAIPLGMLGQQTFTLTFNHTVAAAVGFAVTGRCCVGFISTLRLQLGMGKMVIARCACLILFLNCQTDYARIYLGFSVIAVILAGQVLHNLNKGLLLAVGVVIIGLTSVSVCFFGYVSGLRYINVTHDWPIIIDTTYYTTTNATPGSS
ncbi:hypothetical protein M422DRAFT_251952 [Sphaerobolus stellatus SS14]|uniref:Uncharacterized protein n=1 Tax=Sphaerobolus stellatus (strain SS14) TaxID=990650 RepID=A0A0C9VQP3_SPHS4|nr:hypothetical protein M422DRAFT_251952 [Sphaerobolus stellatus SS14]